MSIQPKRNNVQKQKLTVLLRSIISEYPAGGGVLRELCQNADDAGATKVVFVLDENTYADEPLLHGGLQEYQGPALLAYNNRQFSDEDFESLSNIGDSRKIKDPTSTGKFGRGFNSVYNWTDCPSILSGDSLVLLDPHEGWSKTTSCPGGPTYDFVTYCDDPTMQNQLAAFREIETDFAHQFDGTIIRLPLRTNDQASHSEVCKKPTTVQNIKGVFRKFTEEMLETLLFLRNVRSITLKIGNVIFSSAEASNYHIPASGDRVPSNFSGEIQTPYRSVLVKKKNERWDDSFVTEIKLLIGGRESMHTFAITHHMRHTVADAELGDWARKAKMFPWVAIAAPLNKTDRKTGRLFSTLPLPVYTRHPVHIHGMFSITPDRANIHNGEDSAASDTSDAAMGARWNKWLFTECVTDAWLQNLELLNTLVVRNEFKFSGWDYWPAGKQGPGHEMEHGTQILRRLMSTIVENNITLVPTILNSVGSPDTCLYANALSSKFRKACRTSKIPIVLPPTAFNNYEFKHHHLCGKLRKWSPKSLRAYINGNVTSFSDLDLETLQTVVEMILVDEDFEDIGKCLGPLLPLKDGSYRAFQKTGASKYKLATTQEEVGLFSQSTDLTVDHDKLSKESNEKLSRHIEQLCKYTSICQWGLKDAAKYCGTYLCASLDGSEGIVEIADPEQQNWIRNMWEWAAAKASNDVNYSNQDLIKVFRGLPIVPLQNQQYRRIEIHQWTTLDVSGQTAFAKILSQTVTTPSATPYPLSSASRLSNKATQFLHAGGLLTKCDDVVPLLTWLCQADEYGFFGVLGESRRLELVRELGQLFIRVGRGQVFESMKALCRKLPLFHKANDRVTKQHGKNGLLSFIPSLFDSAPKLSKWSTLKEYNTQYLGVDSRNINVPLPENGMTFIDVSNPGEAHILSRITGRSSLTLVEVLHSYIMPAIISHPGRVEQNSPDMYQLCCFAMRHLDHLDDSHRSQLSRKAFVPASAIIRAPCELVHPTNPVARLLFEDEDRFPGKEILASFEPQLKQLGMVTDVDETFITDRITEFEKRGSSYDAVAQRVRHLLTYTPPTTPLGNPHASKKWLPACSPDGELVLCSVLECRDKSWSKVLHYATNIAPFEVHYEWAKFLSWDTLPSKELIRTQLLAVAEKQDNDSLKQLLQRGLLQPLSLSGELHKIAWVPGSSGRYFTPSTIFKANAKFPPHMDTVHREFEVLLSERNLCPVAYEPSFEQLHQALKAVSNRDTALEADELRLVTRLLEQVTKRYPEGDFSSFKVPDADGYMQSIDVLTADFSNDLNERHLKFLHLDVTPGTSRALKIPTSKDRMLQSLANSEDFAQEEDSVRMVKDSLQRYPIESTFNEYLANAEDSGSATEIAWLIDWVTYDNRKVLTPELVLFQGPSLLSYNNGVFTEDDLKALIRIGVGSKREDASKLGRFGRGSLTMYHWTCVPMILSGEYLVIFDPQRKRLQNEFYSRRRCAGTKIRIADVRREYPDQLKPFEGANFGFTNQDYFDGTIFRFPLLGETLDVISPTQPTQATARTHLERYFREASHSLLFLHKVKKISISERAGSTTQLLWEVKASDYRHKKTSLKLLAIESVDRTTKPEIKETSRWLVERDSERDHGIPGGLGKLRELHRLQARYGVAISDEPLKAGKVFMDLPLRKIRTELPIFWTADMVLQSNRESVALGRDEEGSEWNHWIIREKVVPLYLFALERLTKEAAKPETILAIHWPPVIPESEKNSHDVITNLVSQYFWEKVVESSCRIYPCLPSKRILRRDEALFNFLDPTMSSILCQILPMFGHTNIVTLSGAAAKGFLDADLHKHSNFRSITPHFVRTLLSNRVHAAQMPDICASKKNLPLGSTIRSLLHFILSDNPEPSELTGCYAIPLGDDSVGMISTSATAGKYLIRNDKVVDPELLHLKPNMCAILGPATARKLLGVFNLEVVNFEHVSRLLEGISTSMSNYPQILTWVWSSLTKTLAENTHDDYPLHVQERRFKQLLKGIPVLTTSAPNEKFTTFHSLEELDSHQYPMVLAQSDPKSQRLLNCFPGLKCIHRKTYIQSRLDREDITKPFGFSRLMSCLAILGASQGLEIYLEEALRAAYGDDRQEVLQLLSTVDLKGLEITACCVSPFTALAQFPIWTVFESGHTSYRSGSKLTLSPDDSNDWSKVAKNSCFLNASYQRQYASMLETMGVKRVGVQEFLEQHLGAITGGKLSPAELPNYVEFFDWFSRSHAVGDYTIVIDGNRNFKRLSDGDLYDSAVLVFVAAFRGALEKDRFLHPRIRQYGPKVQGLIRKLDIETICACALAIHERYNSDEQPRDSQIYADAKTVFEGLTVSFISTPTNRKNLAITTAMLELQFAPVASSFPSSYRRARMLQLVPRDSVAVLRDAILPADMRIAWSQSPVLSCDQPEMIIKLLRQDHTFPTKVVEHLRYLASHSADLTRDDITEFCEDLQATYRFLADHISEVASTLGSTEAVWLNIEDPTTTTIADLQSSWTTASNLVDGLNYDSGNLRQVCGFLRLYTAQNGLLVKCGMKTVKHSKPLPAPSKQGRSHAEILRDEYISFRRAGKYTDFILTVDDDRAGKSIHVHRAVLAAGSPVFRKMLDSNMKESGSGVMEVGGFMYESVMAMVEYIYSGELTGPEDKEVRKMLDFYLELLRAGDMYCMADMQGKVQAVVSSPEYLRPETVREIKDAAEAHKAEGLLEVCRKYESENWEIVEKAMEEQE